MYYSSEDKNIMRGLFIAVDKFPNEIYTLEFSDGTIIRAKIDTLFETDNGIELGEDGYEEYNACAMRVIEIVVLGKDHHFEEGKLTEINYHNYPLSIKTSSGEII